MRMLNKQKMSEVAYMVKRDLDKHAESIDGDFAMPLVGARLCKC